MIAKDIVFASILLLQGTEGEINVINRLYLYIVN